MYTFCRITSGMRIIFKLFLRRGTALSSFFIFFKIMEKVQVFFWLNCSFRKHIQYSTIFQLPPKGVGKAVAFARSKLTKTVRLNHQRPGPLWPPLCSLFLTFSIRWLAGPGLNWTWAILPNVVSISRNLPNQWKPDSPELDHHKLDITHPYG